MKAVILAAGIASRLRPLTNNKPKCLLKIGERCLLERTIDALIKNGITEIIIVTGYLHNMIEDFVNTKYAGLNISFVYNAKYASTNNIYSLWLAKPYITGISQHGSNGATGDGVLLLDSDILFDSQVIAKLNASPYKNCLALNSHELGDEEIKVITGSTGEVIEINKTCPAKDAVGESIGIEKMSPQYIDALFKELDKMINTEGLSNVFYELAFERLIPGGNRFYPVDTSEYFSMELDTVEDFNDAVNRIPKHLL